MSIIALITDFGGSDGYAGVMKGVMAKIKADICFVDISHDVPRHDIKSAAFLLAKSFFYFPKGTVFLAVVDPEVGSARRPIAVKTKNYYFVGPDNGVLSVAAEADQIKTIVLLENKKYFLPKVSSTFHGRDVFAPVAAHISKNTSLSELGRTVKSLKKVELPLPLKASGGLRGEVIYSDKFGNLVTNITKRELLKFVGNNKFTAEIKGRKITRIFDCYEAAGEDELFLVEGGYSLLEVSLKGDDARKFLKIKNNEKVKVLVRAGK